MAGMTRPCLLASLVDLAVQMQRDADRPETELHRRDRGLVRAQAGDASNRLWLLMAWLEGLRAGGEAMPGRSFSFVYRLLVLGLAVLGLGIGWGTSAALFYYDGTRPVNVVHVLAVFVAGQWLLLLLLGIVMIPDRFARWIPGAAGVQETLALLSPGQLARLAIRFVPRTARDLLVGTVAFGAANLFQFKKVWKWAVIFAAQSFAVGFNAGALAACLYLVTFSDLAFSWSTTLEPDVEVVHRLTQTLSAPWSRWAPDAAPSAELIRQTLYYRQAGPLAGTAPERWGQWWPFLAACMIAYGLVPRAFLLGLAGWRLHRSARRAFVEAPGVAVVLDRLTSEWVTTQSTDPEAKSSQPSNDAAGIPNGAGLADRSPLCLVNWGGIEVPDETLAGCASESWSRRIARVHHAGGRASIESDGKVIADISKAAEQPGVAVLVKSWEPPVLEATDFLRELRQAIGPGRLMIVAPVALDAAGGLAPPRDADLVQWRKSLRGLRDPALVVRGWQEGETP